MRKGALRRRSDSAYLAWRKRYKKRVQVGTKIGPRGATANSSALGSGGKCSGSAEGMTEIATSIALEVPATSSRLTNETSTTYRNLALPKIDHHGSGAEPVGLVPHIDQSDGEP